MAKNDKKLRNKIIFAMMIFAFFCLIIVTGLHAEGRLNTVKLDSPKIWAIGIAIAGGALFALIILIIICSYLYMVESVLSFSYFFSIYKNNIYTFIYN